MTSDKNVILTLKLILSKPKFSKRVLIRGGDIISEIVDTAKTTKSVAKLGKKIFGNLTQISEEGFEEIVQSARANPAYQILVLIWFIRVYSNISFGENFALNISWKIIGRLLTTQLTISIDREKTVALLDTVPINKGILRIKANSNPKIFKLIRQQQIKRITRLKNALQIRQYGLDLARTFLLIIDLATLFRPEFAFRLCNKRDILSLAIIILPAGLILGPLILILGMNQTKIYPELVRLIGEEDFLIRQIALFVSIIFVQPMGCGLTLFSGEGNGMSIKPEIPFYVPSPSDDKTLKNPTKIKKKYKVLEKTPIINTDEIKFEEPLSLDLEQQSIKSKDAFRN